MLVTRTTAVAEDITQNTGDDAALLISQDTVDEVAGVPGVKAGPAPSSRTARVPAGRAGRRGGRQRSAGSGRQLAADPALSVATITQGSAPQADEIVVDEVTFPKLEVPGRR